MSGDEPVTVEQMVAEWNSDETTPWRHTASRGGPKLPWPLVAALARDPDTDVRAAARLRHLPRRHDEPLSEDDLPFGVTCTDVRLVRFHIGDGSFGEEGPLELRFADGRVLTFDVWGGDGIEWSDRPCDPRLYRHDDQTRAELLPGVGLWEQAPPPPEFAALVGQSLRAARLDAAEVEMRFDRHVVRCHVSEGLELETVVEEARP